MAKNPPLLLVALLFFTIQSLTAQTLDLTKGLGKFTWGISYGDALKVANDTYGADNVNGSKQPDAPNSRRVQNPLNFPALPRPNFQRYPPAALQQLQSGIAVRTDNGVISLEFLNDHLYLISKRINAMPVNGLFSEKEFYAAKLGEKLKAQIKVPNGVTLSTNVNESSGNLEVGGDEYIIAADVYFTATNNDVFNEELAKIKAGNPDLAKQLFTPILAQ